MEKKLIDEYKSVVNSIKLAEDFNVNCIINKEPVIYLCGKSSTGKTTFLNALLELKKNELYTSTDISTRTEFRFTYGKKEKILVSNGNEIDLPKGADERKSLFEKLNNDHEKCNLVLNKSSLRGRTIVDIPGVFDFKRENHFADQMLEEADVIYYFTPCTAKVNADEFNLLTKISEVGIPIVVLFTMGDITEVDEGITRKSMPAIVKHRLTTCFDGINVLHYQIISSNDFYRGRETHGINDLQTHITNHDVEYKCIAEDKRLLRKINICTSYINSIMGDMNVDIEAFTLLTKREMEISNNYVKDEIEKKKQLASGNVNRELNWILKFSENAIYSDNFAKVFQEDSKPISEIRCDFETGWRELWQDIKKTYRLENLDVVKLPSYDDQVFEVVSIDWDCAKDLFTDGVDKVNMQSHLGSLAKSVYRHSASRNKLSLDEILEIAVKLGLNLKNGKVAYEKWKLIHEIKSVILDYKEVIYNHLETAYDSEIKETTSRIELEMNKSLDENPVKERIKSLVIALEKLAIIRDAI